MSSALGEPPACGKDESGRRGGRDGQRESGRTQQREDERAAAAAMAGSATAQGGADSIQRSAGSGAYLSVPASASTRLVRIG